MTRTKMEKQTKRYFRPYNEAANWKAKLKMQLIVLCGLPILLIPEKFFKTKWIG